LRPGAAAQSYVRLMIAITIDARQQATIRTIV
jgi:hypothetical protein